MLPAPGSGVSERVPTELGLSLQLVVPSVLFHRSLHSFSLTQLVLCNCTAVRCRRPTRHDDVMMTGWTASLTWRPSWRPQGLRSRTCWARCTACPGIR